MKPQACMDSRGQKKTSQSRQVHLFSSTGTQENLKGSTCAPVQFQGDPERPQGLDIFTCSVPRGSRKTSRTRHFHLFSSKGTQKNVKEHTHKEHVHLLSSFCRMTKWRCLHTLHDHRHQPGNCTHCTPFLLLFTQYKV